MQRVDSRHLDLTTRGPADRKKGTTFGHLVFASVVVAALLGLASVWVVPAVEPVSMSSNAATATFLWLLLSGAMGVHYRQHAKPPESRWEYAPGSTVRLLGSLSMALPLIGVAYLVLAALVDGDPTIGLWSDNMIAAVATTLGVLSAAAVAVYAVLLNAEQQRFNDFTTAQRQQFSELHSLLARLDEEVSYVENLFWLKRPDEARTSADRFGFNVPYQVGLALGRSGDYEKHKGAGFSAASIANALRTDCRLLKQLVAPILDEEDSPARLVNEEAYLRAIRRLEPLLTEIRTHLRSLGDSTTYLSADAEFHLQVFSNYPRLCEHLQSSTIGLNGQMADSSWLWAQAMLAYRPIIEFDDRPCPTAEAQLKSGYMHGVAEHPHGTHTVDADTPEPRREASGAAVTNHVEADPLWMQVIGARHARGVALSRLRDLIAGRYDHPILAAGRLTMPEFWERICDRTSDAANLPVDLDHRLLPRTIADYVADVQKAEV